MNSQEYLHEQPWVSFQNPRYVVQVVHAIAIWRKDEKLKRSISCNANVRPLISTSLSENRIYFSLTIAERKCT